MTQCVQCALLPGLINKIWYGTPAGSVFLVSNIIRNNLFWEAETGTLKEVSMEV